MSCILVHVERGRIESHAYVALDFVEDVALVSSSYHSPALKQESALSTS